MTRFGDFTLLEELAESEVADCFEATHDVHGGPFFLKRYRRVDPAYSPALLYRCEVLMAVQHENLAPHLGHGDVDGVVFTVSPFLDGIDLDGFIESVRQRRVVLKLEALLYIVRQVARGVAALHAAAHDGQRALLAHGDVCTRHVRLGASGEVWLTGLPTPRGLSPDRPPETIWDSAGLGALLYDLIPLTRTGGQRPPLPGALDRVVRRTLGIGPVSDQMPPFEFAERLDEVAEVLKLPRLEPRVLQDAAARAIQHRTNVRSMSAADALPTLEPVVAAPAEPPPPPRPPVEAKPPPRPPVEAPPPAEVQPFLVEPSGADEDMPPPTRPLPPPARAASRPPPRPTPTAPPAKPVAPAPPVEPPAPPPRASGEETTRKTPIAPIAPAEESLADLLDLDEPPHRAATPLDELGGLTAVPPAAAPSVPWVAPPDEPSRRHVAAPGPAVIADELDAPFDAPPFDDEPLDPFVERTLPGHLVESLPSDEPAAFEANPTPLTAPVRGGDTFEEDRTRPDLSAFTAPAGRTQSDPARPALLSDAPKPDAPKPDAPSPDLPKAEVPKALAVPRAVSAIVKLDEPLRAELGFLADAADAPAGPFADEGTFEEDPAVAALLARGTVTAAQVREAREAQQSRGGKVPEILVALGFTTDALVADALAAEAVKPRLGDPTLFAHLPEPDLCRRLPQTYALGRRMLPLVVDGGQLTLAVADPFDEAGIREVTRLVGASGVRVHVAARAPLTDATLKAYRALGARLTSGEGTPSVLLCMQDEEETARFGARLADEGFHVAHAADVPTAKMLLDAHPPAAIVVGLDVPDAESLLVFTRGHDDHADTPVFVTGEAGDDEAVGHLLDLGADDFFERPASLNLVLAKLRRALNKRGAAPAAEGRAPAAKSPPPVAAAPPPPEPPSVPPPTFDFWENSAPLDEMASDEGAPGDTRDNAPLYAEPTGVMGTLRQMAVTEIVQSLELGRKTARVELVPTDGQRGMVGFDEGRVVYAECGELRGEQAFYSLARHTEGFFRIRYGEGPSEQNVEGSTTFLLLEAMRLMDEENPSEPPDDIGAEKTPTPFD